MTTFHYVDLETLHEDILTADQLAADLRGIRNNLDDPTQAAWVDTILAAITAGCMTAAAEYLRCMGIEVTPIGACHA